MIREFEVIHPDASLEEVARKLKDSAIDPLPVCMDGRLVGMVRHEEVKDRGIFGGIFSGRKWRPKRIGEVIAPDVVYCFENTEVTEAAMLMKEYRVQLLPVLSSSKTVVGVLALKDIPGERGTEG